MRSTTFTVCWLWTGHPHQRTSLKGEINHLHGVLAVDRASAPEDIIERPTHTHTHTPHTTHTHTLGCHMPQPHLVWVWKDLVWVLKKEGGGQLPGKWGGSKTCVAFCVVFCGNLTLLLFQFVAFHLRFIRRDAYLANRAEYDAQASKSHITTLRGLGFSKWCATTIVI